MGDLRNDFSEPESESYFESWKNEEALESVSWHWSKWPKEFGVSVDFGI